MADSTKKDIFKIYITGEDGTQVDAVVSEDIALGLSSDFGSIYDSNNDNPLGKALHLAGQAGLTSGAYTTVTVQGSTQIWKGSSSGSFAFELSLVTWDDPVKDVRDKIIALYKMVVPSLGVGTTVGGVNLSLVQAPSPVSIEIPGVIRLDEYYVTNVNFTQSKQLIRQSPGGTPLPLRAIGTIEVIPSKMLLKSDIGDIFPNGSA